MVQVNQLNLIINIDDNNDNDNDDYEMCSPFVSPCSALENIV